MSATNKQRMYVRKSLIWTFIWSEGRNLIRLNPTDPRKTYEVIKNIWFMGLFRGYKTIPPAGFPSNWLSESINESEKYFKMFCSEKIQIPELKRVTKLIEKKSVQEFIEPVISKGYYKIVASMSVEELDQMPNLSAEQHKSKFFGLIKNNAAKISIGGKEIIPHRLKNFAKIVLPKEIQFLEPSKKIKSDEEVIKVCSYCDRGKINRGKSETVTELVPGYRRASSTKNSFGGDDGSGSWVPEHYETWARSLEAKCSACDGKWKTGFSFKDFSEYIKEFNENVEKIDKEIKEVNEKGSKLVEEYNKIIEKLNSNISIWNNKCPSNAIDKNHESDDDYFKYWDVTKVNSPISSATIPNPTSTRGSLPKGYVAPDSQKRDENASLGIKINNNDEIQHASDVPLKILQLRYAKGEITREEFEEMKKMIK